MKFSALSPLNI